MRYVVFAILIVLILVSWLGYVHGQPVILEKPKKADDVLKGFKVFKKTRESQSPEIWTNEGGFPDYDPNSWAMEWKDPRRYLSLRPVPTLHRSADGTTPWMISGGMEKHTGWTSKGMVKWPEGGKVTVWIERVEGGAIEPLPVKRWEYPEGTVLADVLSTDKGTFEIRTRTKLKTSWKSKAVWKDYTKAPAGYEGLKANCNACHERAGEWQSYGAMAQGSDTVFSFPVFEEGTLTYRVPVKYWGHE